jgi:hypothetical protein
MEDLARGGSILRSQSSNDARSHIAYLQNLDIAEASFPISREQRLIACPREWRKYDYESAEKEI